MSALPWPIVPLEWIWLWKRKQPVNEPFFVRFYCKISFQVGFGRVSYIAADACSIYWINMRSMSNVCSKVFFFQQVERLISQYDCQSDNYHAFYRWSYRYSSYDQNTINKQTHSHTHTRTHTPSSKLAGPTGIGYMNTGMAGVTFKDTFKTLHVNL